MQPSRQLTIARDFEVRRTELTCPAHSMKMMTRAAASTADEVIFDLEDACAVSQKLAARTTLVEAFRTLDFKGKIRAYRANGVQTGYFYRDVIDVLESVGDKVDVLVVPKVESAEEVRFADRLVSQIEQSMGLTRGRIGLEVLIESAQGLLEAQAIAAASSRLASLIFGVADYAGDIGARAVEGDERALFHYPRAHLLAAARAAGICAIDSVTLQFRDLERVRADAAASARMGFDGKWAVHPGQLEPINAAYTPTRTELERALEILRAYEAADGEGVGAIVVGDEMVDAASLRVEWRKLSVARKAGLLTEAGELVDAGSAILPCP